MNPTIEIFTTSNCENCRIAKMILEQYGLSFIEKNIETNEEFEKEFIEKTQGQKYVPTLIVNDQIFINIKPHELLALVQKIKAQL